jgi:hypothetical protein
LTSSPSSASSCSGLQRRRGGQLSSPLMLSGPMPPCMHATTVAAVHVLFCTCGGTNMFCMRTFDTKTNEPV